MERHTVAAVAKPGFTPRTAEATFVISSLDVGSQAVRPGCMADLEQEREVLLLAAKLVLERIRRGGALDSICEYALDAAIKQARPL